MLSAFIQPFVGSALPLFLRLTLSTIMVYFGMYKLHDNRTFHRTLKSLVDDEHICTFLAIGVPLTETVLGVLLIFDVIAPLVTLCIEGLVLLFSMVLWYGWRTKKMDECGCGRVPLPPWTAFMRNCLLLLIGGCLYWHPDATTFSPIVILLEGTLVLFVALIATRGGSSHDSQLQEQHAIPLPARRTLLRQGAAAFGAAFLLPLLNPTTSLAFACSCSCDGGGYYAFGDCICGVQEVYYVEVTLCCYINTVCDEWALGVGLADC